MADLQGYYSRHDPNSGYIDVKFLANKGLQSAELNEMQAIARDQARGIGDALISDGDVISGCECLVSESDVSLAGGKVYIQGHVYTVGSGELQVATTGTVRVGVWLTLTTVTHLEDPTLVDPAVGTRNYQEPGAARLKATIAWGLETDIVEGGDFYPVHTIIDGVLLVKAPPPQLDSVNTALARYDREANGSYVVDGMRTTVVDASGGKQIFSVSDGKAHIDGFELELPSALRLLVDDNPALATINSEPHRFSPDEESGTSMTISLNNTPVAQIKVIDITREETVDITHGGYSGALDALPNNAVLSLIEVSQSGTTFVEGTDYKLTGDQVDWSPGGSEPAPGSTYQVTYQFRVHVNADSSDESGFVVSDVVPDTLVMVDYDWKLPRVDAITIDREGNLKRIDGLSHARAAVPPDVPVDQLTLAYVEQNWMVAGVPKVTDVGIRVVPMDDLQTMRDSIIDLYGLIAIERLRNDANAQEPAAKHGIFVDPFIDDDMRDQGLAQNAAIVGRELVLPVGVSVADAGMDTSIPWTLEFDREPVLEQKSRTGSMKINPYQAFEPLPARVRLRPSVDRWSISQTQWTSAATRTITSGWGTRWRTSSSTSVQSLGTTSRTISTLRSRSVTFEVNGFGDGELLDELRFDGAVITPDGVTVHDGGRVTGSFTVPSGLPTGSKQVEFIGAGGSYGETTYTGSGTISIQRLRRVTTVRRVGWTPWTPPPIPTPRRRVRVDPLAQTFTLNEGRHIAGVDLMFVVKGTTQVRVQIRETNVGIPNQVVLAEGEITADVVSLTDPTRIEWEPVWLEQDREYAFVVMSDDPIHEIATAQLGKFDSSAQRWITAQPYQVGVLLSSSNASTWTAHQDQDLWFSLLGAKFSQASRVIDLGSITASQTSDLLALAGVENTAPDTDITLVLSDQSGEVARIQGEQPINFPTRLDGDYDLTAELHGDDWHSPVLYPGVQTILGDLDETATYITRAIPAGTNVRVSVTYEANTPGQSNVTVQCQQPDDSFLAVPFIGSTPVGDGFEESRNVLENFTGDTTRVRLTLSGNPVDRPRVRNLKVVITDV